MEKFDIGSTMETCGTTSVIISDYNHRGDRLLEVLIDAYDQAMGGKGKERHSSGEEFTEQPICYITRQTGIGYPMGQAVKKILESKRLAKIKGYDSAITELLGAIVYTAAAVLEYQRRKMLVGEKGEAGVIEGTSNVQ